MSFQLPVQNGRNHNRAHDHTLELLKSTFNFLMALNYLYSILFIRNESILKLASWLPPKHIPDRQELIRSGISERDQNMPSKQHQTVKPDQVSGECALSQEEEEWVELVCESQ